MSNLLTLVMILVALAVAIAIAVGLAYIPMRLLIGQMASNIREFIQRQRDRRNAARSTPDRRKV